VSREPALAAQTVVVIGGSSGIGLETARRARSEGADVVLAGRNPERLEHAARELGALSSAACDATDFERLERFFDDLPTPIDHVMVAAGGPYYAAGRHRLPTGGPQRRRGLLAAAPRRSPRRRQGAPGRNAPVHRRNRRSPAGCGRTHRGVHRRSASTLSRPAPRPSC
jgi:NAD(P)-dependent dehydrogenase (short-subunit alcohol dehydrogenase family)